MKFKINLPILKEIQQGFEENLGNKKVAFGLDIGSSTVKLVKIRCEKERVELLDFRCLPTQMDITPLIREITTSVGCHKVNISVSGPGIIIRYVQFPKMNKEDLEQSLHFEAQKHIPFSVDEVFLDSHILKDDLPDNKMLVLLAATKKDFILQRLKSVEEAGVTVALIDIDSLALINAFNFNYSDIFQEGEMKNKSVALLHLGAQVTCVNILENGSPRLTREIQLGGNQLTQRISESLGLDFKEVEALKSTPEKNQKINGIIEPILTNLAREVRFSFDYYESQSASNVSKIFIIGGTAKLKGIKESLEGLLNIPVEDWDPLRKIILANSIKTEKIKQYVPQLAVAVGLGLRG